MYTPKPEDIRWITAALSMIKHTGLLVYPDANLRYRIDKSKKEFHLVNPEQLVSADSFHTHMRTVAVIAKVGYHMRETKVTTAAELIEEHFDICPICTGDSPFLCIVAHHLLDFFYQAITMAVILGEGGINDN